MQLAHFIPHLDAEIDRLQKARDLLALVPSPHELFTSAQDKPVSLQATHPNRLVMNHAAALIIESPVIPALVDAPGSRSPRTGKMRMRRPYTPHEEPRQIRRKHLVLVDTALRGAVPTGPIVVSAEDVRKSQASKTAQATRAAEVKRAGSELVSSFGWRSRSSDLHTVDAMLQRLINIGEEGRQSLTQLPAHERSENLQAARTHLASKLDLGRSDS